MNEQKLKILTREEAIDLLDNQIEYTFQLEKQNQELHNKIKKAIEYIEKETIYNNYNEIYRGLLDSRNVNYLLKLLKDSDVDGM